MLLNLNLIRFPFKHLLISEVSIRTQWRRGRAAAFRAKELAGIAFSGYTFPEKMSHLPLGWTVSESSGAGLPLRPEQEVESSH